MPPSCSLSGPTLILDCYVQERKAALAVFLPPADSDHRVVAAARGPLSEIPLSAMGFSSILVTGSAAHVLDKSPWSERTAALLRSAAEHRVPTLGVCFGHQLLAYALFGDAAVRRARQPEFGWKDIELCYDDVPLTQAVAAAGALRRGSATSFRCFMSHEDEVVPHFPGSAELRFTARTDSCPTCAFEHQSLPLCGVQFHPELPVPVCKELLAVRSAEHPELAIDVAKQLDRETDTSALWEALTTPLFLASRRAA